MNKFLLYALFALFLFPAGVFAQELHQEEQGVWRAEVVEVVRERTSVAPGSNVETRVQEIKVRLLEGEREGETITFENDYIELEEGDSFYLNYLITIGGEEIYSVRGVDRRSGIGILAGIFALVVLTFGGLQGLRSLLSLTGSLLVIIFVLVPALVAGYSPVPTSIAIAGAVLFFAIFFTHGFNKRTLVAYTGTMIAVVLTGLLAYFSIALTNLTGFSSDEAVYLNLNTGGQLDFVGLLLAAIIIGALGVLDDIAVTQVAVVRELLGTKVRMAKREVYKAAMRVGKSHIGSLINTLVLAYAGVSLPLLLLFSLSDASFLGIVNREIFATEIVRALVGSIGLVLAVPITTVLAVFVLARDRQEEV